MSKFPVTERTQVRRLPKRAVYDREEVYRILDEGLVCHIGFIADGRPVVAPCKLSFAMGREPAAATVSRIGPGVSPPRIISKTEPEYAEEARQARYQGTVVLQAVVDSTGLPRDLKVIRPLGLGLDEKAIEAVSQWRFQPGMKDGDAVAVLVTVEVNFRLFGNDRKWHLISINFGTPSGASRPRLVNAKFPETSDAPDSSVNVAFDIDDQGKPVNIKVDKLSSEKLEREILAAIRDWRFVPSAKDGKAVLVPAHVLLGR
jgi:TonB family protein